MMDRHAVLTIATGKPVFVEMAANLARSFLFWHRDARFRFVLATDQPDAVPPDVADRIDLLRIRPGEYGEGFSPKLHLDRIAPAERTLFIDADSLCVGPLDECFRRFAGQPVGVIAGRITTGEWFGDVAAVCRRLGLVALPKFNGGVYYVERGELATRVYDTARQLEPRYHELGLVRLRGSPNEELLVAIAMATHGLWGIPEDGSLMAEPLNFACGMSVDVLRGRALLRNTPGHPRYQPTWPFEEARPLIVHFLGSHAESPPYTREVLRLQIVQARRWPIWFASAIAAVRHTLPHATRSLLKRMLRPAYRALFGYRPIAASPRL